MPGHAQRPRVGVVALQGCVEPHLRHLRAAGADARAVRTAEEIAQTDALILPGGESGAWLRLLAYAGLFEPLRAAAAERPVWGICAGAILLAREVQAPQASFGLIDMVIARNAYGRQLDSFNAEICGCEVAFIRAPRVVQCGSAVQVEARHAGDPVFVRQGLRWATTFHPELGASAPSPFHARFAALAADDRTGVAASLGPE